LITNKYRKIYYIKVIEYTKGNHLDKSSGLGRGFNMNLLLTTDLSIKALIYMTLNQGEISLLADMSSIFQANPTTFKRPFRKLVKNKIIITHAGRNGGYSLARNPSKIFLGKIIKMLEPDVPMISWMRFDEDSVVDYLKSTYNLAIKEAETSFFSTLDRYTIADFANDPHTQKSLKIEHLVQK